MLTSQLHWYFLIYSNWMWFLWRNKNAWGNKSRAKAPNNTCFQIEFYGHKNEIYLTNHKRYASLKSDLTISSIIFQLILDFTLNCHCINIDSSITVFLWRNNTKRPCIRSSIACVYLKPFPTPCLLFGTTSIYRRISIVKIYNALS